MVPKITSWMFTLLVSLSMTSVVIADGVSPDQPDASHDGFVSVDIKETSINGKAHAIAAYAIIISVLFLYSYSLLHREKSVRKDLERLKKALKSP